jgi:hypothetical protein
MSDRVLNGNFYFPVDGHFVSQKQVRINEILTDYDPKLQLQWIPPNKRSSEDLAFRVVCFPSNGYPPYLVCTAEEADERLLAKVFEADQANSPNKLNYIENYNRALELTKAKEDEEARQEAHAMAAALIRNDKSSYKVRINGEVIDLERPRCSHSGKTYIW